jgi:hypothetical protein
MLSFDKLVAKVEVQSSHANKPASVQPILRQYYQSNGDWYAVFDVFTGDGQAKIHIALPK